MNTDLRARENAGSVEVVLIANQTHHESYRVRLFMIPGRAR